MTNEEKIAELIKVSKMPMEEANAYIKQYIAKRKMKNTINEDNENNNHNIEFKTIFKLTRYNTRKSKGRRYPTFRVEADARSTYFSTRAEAEERLRHLTGYDRDAYCWVLSEIPLGINHLSYESFSERVYLPDGQLWGERPYADMLPGDIPPQYGEIEFDNYLYGRNYFAGRRPEEIRFQPGDIIEVFCYDGNHYWSVGYGELAIVLETPPTVEVISELSERYLKSGRYLTNDRGFDLGTRINALYDAYTIVDAYVSLSTEGDPIDYCPTHCAMRPLGEISTKMRNKLEALQAKVMENEEWQQRLISKRLITGL